MNQHVRSVLAAVVVLAAWCVLRVPLQAAAQQPAAEGLKNPIEKRIETGEIAIRLEPVTREMSSPVTLTAAPGDRARLFVVDQIGIVRIVENGKLLPEPLLDVRSRLVTLDPRYDERGLLGFAFHPGFNDPRSPGYRKLYTHTSEPVTERADFSVDLQPDLEFDHQAVIAEWQVSEQNPNRVDPATRREILRVNQPNSNHNGGALVFGPQDGLLYIPLGDGGGADDQQGQPLGRILTVGRLPGGNGQNIHTVLGKILRIDPLGDNSANGKYGVPQDNPFVGRDGIDEIFALGFRNPYQISFTPDGQLVAADVGQASIEEVDVVKKGGNYGWRLKEGSFEFVLNGTDVGDVVPPGPDLPEGLIDPVLEYDHDEGSAVVGGLVYRGSQIPELQGKYVFGDLHHHAQSGHAHGDAGPEHQHEDKAQGGRLFYADLKSGEIKEFRFVDQEGLDLFLKGFGEGPDNELYVLASPTMGPVSTDGTVFKVVPATDSSPRSARRP